MTLVLFEFISACAQILLFTLVPFIFFLFRKDKSVTFFKYIGLVRPSQKSITYVIGGSLLFVLAGIGVIFVDEGFKQAVFSPNSVTGKLRMMGLSGSSVAILLIIALLKTSFSEEILFRGFISKQLINKLGFTTGNLLQSAIFGLIHVLLFWILAKSGLISLLFIFLFSSFAGWTIAYIKEKYANGSIIPGWIAHGLGNTLSYSIIVFIL